MGHIEQNCLFNSFKHGYTQSVDAEGGITANEAERMRNLTVADLRRQAADYIQRHADTL